MIALNDGASSTVFDLTTTEQILLAKLQMAFGKTGHVAGLHLYLRSTSGKIHPIVRHGEPVELADLEASLQSTKAPGLAHSAIVHTQGTDIIVESSADAALGKVTEALVREAADAFEAECREELLLSEVAANWESLDAIYEISADVLRSGDVKEAVHRLINRLATSKKDLHAALFILKDNSLQTLVCTAADPGTFPVSEIGLVAQIFKGRRALVVNDLQSGTKRPSSQVCWRSATSLAAAPVTLQSAVIGCVVVWTENKELKFDTPFSRLIETLSQNASLLMECDSLTQTVRENERMAHDVEIASTIQETLLTGETPKGLPGMEFAAFTVPSQRIDGDFYEFYPHNENLVDILIGDVMGKGVAAALLGVAAKSNFIRELASLGNQDSGELEPAQIVQAVSDRLNNRLIELERFITLSFTRFDLEQRELKYVDCGHTNTLVHRKRTGETLLLQGENLPLGIQANQRCTQASLKFESGDTFLFYSDGVTENRSGEDEFFGDDRLMSSLETWSSLGPEVLIQQLRKEAAEFCTNNTFSDDFTLIASRVGLHDGPPLKILHTQFQCELSELERAREWLTIASEEVPGGLGEEALTRLQLAWGEAFDNCIVHGSGTPCALQVRLECYVYPDSLTVNLRHQGPAFDPFSVPPPSFDGSRDGGFGLYIISRSADELEYKREPDDTNLVSISIVRKRENEPS